MTFSSAHHSFNHVDSCSLRMSRKLRCLLNNVCARAKHGEITAIVGPSGAGKSTFLDAIAGRIMASSLEVFFKMFL